MTLEKKEETKRCKYCDKEISAKAKKCPFCQTDLRGFFRRHQIFTLLGILFLSSLMFGGMFSTNKGGQESKPILTEEQIQQNLIEQKKWEQSKAGKICKEHSDWTKEDCDRLADNRVWIGMSYDMLIYLRGKPNAANPSNYGHGTRWQWCWYNRTPSCFYDDNDDGIVESYN